MPPKQQRVVVERADRRRPNSAPKGYIGQAYSTLTAPENASVVRSVAIFGVSEDLTAHRILGTDTVLQVAVAFFASSWSEVLLPP